MMPGAPLQFLGPHSVNIFLTDQCNRRCPFCYLNNWVTNDEKTAHHMTLKDLRTLIRWLKKSKINKVKLAGGEPMLHPNLIDFVKELMKNHIIINSFNTRNLSHSNSVA